MVWLEERLLAKRGLQLSSRCEFFIPHASAAPTTADKARGKKHHHLVVPELGVVDRIVEANREVHLLDLFLHLRQVGATNQSEHAKLPTALLLEQKITSLKRLQQNRPKTLM